MPAAAATTRQHNNTTNLPPDGGVGGGVVCLCRMSNIDFHDTCAEILWDVWCAVDGTDTDNRDIMYTYERVHVCVKSFDMAMRDDYQPLNM